MQVNKAEGVAVPDGERESRVVRAMIEMADTLVDDYDVADLLHQLAGHCVELIDAAAAGILLTDGTQLHVVAASSEQTRLLELFQLYVNDGPCLEAFRTGTMVTVEDFRATTDEWPQFVSAAVDQGYLSVQAFPLRLRGQTIGAMNLFGTEVGALTEADTLVAQALADTATIGILHERAVREAEVLGDQLQSALTNRVAIEQAKGILAQAGDLDMGQAFEILRSHSRSTSTKMSAIAHDIVLGILAPAVLLGDTVSRKA